MEAVRRRLGDTAAEVMGRLSAASMESYPRAYPHLVRLHMLQVGPDSPSEPACNAYLKGEKLTQQAPLGSLPCTGAAGEPAMRSSQARAGVWTWLVNAGLVPR